MKALTPAQTRELEEVVRCGQPARLRIQALAILNVAVGRRISEVAKFLRVTRQSIYNWLASYEDAGVAGLRVAPGRGRPSKVDEDEVMRYVHQSPRKFGLKQTRWTLEALSRAVPSLHGYSRAGVKGVLDRLGLSYKRGQPRMHSPDPAYEVKKSHRGSAGTRARIPR